MKVNILESLNIVSNGDNMSSQIFESLHLDFRQLTYSSPSDYVRQYWIKYENYCIGRKVNPSQNGKIFEYILATLLIRENILPIFLNAKVAFVPNVVYDIMLYTAERGPICISAKTSLRERYKQADLESIALKYVHRRSLCYLITNNESEANSVKTKIKKGDVIGLDNVIYSFSTEFDDLIKSLKDFDFVKPKPIEVITSNQIVTPEVVNMLI